MDKQQAKRIIKDAFESHFNRDKYIYFLRELLNSFDDEGARVNYGARIPEKFQDHVEKIERVGKYTTDINEVMLFIVYLKRETAIERARTMQRNFVAWYLSQGEKDAALVAYVSPDQSDWRFSLVKMETKIQPREGKTPRIVDEFTPARRWSFLVGEHEKSHTAQSRLVDILADDEHAPTLVELENAFDIETVTKEFFREYRNLFLRTKESLDKVVKNNPKVKADFEAKGVDTVNFAKKLLGQIVFLYFLQKKGWFGVGRDDDWGTGSKHFLHSLFAKQHGDYQNFFNDILEPLFYEALRRDRSDVDHYYSHFNCKIPFLNGGLFDPIGCNGGYDWHKIDIFLPDELFSNKNKTKDNDEGDGILDVFDRYNFTVREDEPLEKEVAIDPELLGKAYEKFNAIRPDNFDEFTKALKSGNKGEENKFNKKFGVYYTPREIVHYMCQQSLINYLFTQAVTAKLSNSIKKQDIEDLIEVGEMITEHEETALIKQEKIKNGIQKSTEYSTLLSESIRENAFTIDKWLEDITVCDPAVGSGAFPVGMMNEIVRARNVLSVFLNENKRSDYEFKRRCIEHSLYGVDIDPGAVEIAKLRLWLSLVVDEEDIKNIKPLPNLDYKIVRGNSLIGFPDNYESPISMEIEELKTKHFNETNPRKKSELIDQIDAKLKKRYDNSRRNFGYQIDFDFRLAFSEVFHSKNGFDVVIANPPYVAGKSGSISASEKKYFNNNYETAEYQLDTYILFTEKGLKICSIGGILTYIMPNTWLANLRLIRIREFLLVKSNLLNIVINPEDTFEAVVDTIILITMRGNNPKNIISISNFKESEIQEFNKIEQEVFYNNEKHVFDIHLDNRKRSIVSKIETKSLRIRDICDVNRGVHAYRKEGYGKSKFGNGFQTEKDYLERSYHSNKKLDETYFSEVRGKNVLPYFFRLSNKYVSWGDWLAEPREWKYFTGERIYLRKIVGKTLYAAYVNCVNVADQSVYIAKIKQNNIYTKFLLSLLNSRLLSWYFRIKTNEFDNLFPQIKVTEFKEMPVKVANDQHSFINIVDKILSITKDDDYLDNPTKQTQVKEYEKQIDRMVYNLYDLTEEEIRIVEGETK